MLFNVPHGVVDLGPDVRRFGEVEQVVETAVRGQAGRGTGLFQLGALLREPHFGEPQENQAEDGLGILGGTEAGIGTELVSGIPQPFLQCIRIGIFFRRGDPLHRSSGLPFVFSVQSGVPSTTSLTTQEDETFFAFAIRSTDS